MSSRTDLADVPVIDLPSPSTRSKRPAPRGTASYPRKRAVTACQVCRARRTKCDNAKPVCSFCKKTGAQCVQSPVDLSSFDPASLKILERLDDLEDLLQRIPTRDEVRTASRNIHRVSIVSREVSVRELLPGPLESFFGWPCFHVRNGLDKKRILSSLSCLSWSDTSASPFNTCAPSPATISADLEPQTTKILLDSFFEFCHVKNPIFTSEASIRRIVAQISLYGVDWSAQSCLALLVCALGAISTPFGDSETSMPGSKAYATAQSYYIAAQKRLGACLAAAGVIEAQCLFLAGVFHMCIFQPGAAWRYFNQALACCQELTFLGQQSNLRDGMEDFEVQQAPSPIQIAEQAIYCSSWKSEREVRLVLQPVDFKISVNEQLLYPVFFPTPPARSESCSSDVDVSQAEREGNGWYFYLTEISLRRLSSSMCGEMIALQTEGQRGLLEQLARSLPAREAQIDEWISNLPHACSLQTDPIYDEVTKFVIRGHLINLYETIYWPFLDAYILLMETSQAHTASNLQTTLDVPIVDIRIQEFAEKSLRNHVRRINVNRAGFRHRHHGTWFMIRSCTGSALVLIKAALFVLQRQLPDNHISQLTLPEGWKDAVVEAIELNRYWEAESLDARMRLPFLEALLTEIQFI